MVSGSNRFKRMVNRVQREEIDIHFSSCIGISYKEDLERLFFFHSNQKRFTEQINRSIREYSKPVLRTDKTEVSLEFEDRHLGQTLYIFDGDYPGANLIGVLMYARDSNDTVTLVHFVLHEGCGDIYKTERINIASIVLDKFRCNLKKLKGVHKIRIYYIDTVIPVGQYSALSA